MVRELRRARVAGDVPQNARGVAGASQDLLRGQEPAAGQVALMPRQLEGWLVDGGVGRIGHVEQRANVVKAAAGNKLLRVLLICTGHDPGRLQVHGELPRLTATEAETAESFAASAKAAARART